MVQAAVAGDPMLLLAETVNETLPAVVGVPESTPLEERVSPAGTDPVVTEKVGAGLPVATNVYEYTVAAVAPGGVDAVNAGAAVPEAMTIVKLAVALGLRPFDAVMVNVDVPPADGTPEITPVVLLRVSPAGSVPTVTESFGAGLPVVVTVPVYATPAVPVVGSVVEEAAGRIST
jgi:hypothetical protein